MHTNFWLENLKGGDHFEDADVNEMIILEWILWEIWGRCKLDLSGSS
jgi:hypothetical protein